MNIYLYLLFDIDVHKLKIIFDKEILNRQVNTILTVSTLGVEWNILLSKSLKRKLLNLNYSLYMIQNDSE